MAKNDGGPAFPCTGNPDWKHDSGMTLRQWYAGMALSPTLVQAYGNVPSMLAKKAFEIADAMIEAEKEKEKI